MKKPDAVDAVLANYKPGEAGPLRELCTNDNQQSLLVDIAALLDDVRLVGPPPVFVFAAQHLKALTTTLCTGLKWNISKCCAWSPEILTETMFDGLSDGSSRICTPPPPKMVLSYLALRLTHHPLSGIGVSRRCNHTHSCCSSFSLCDLSRSPSSCSATVRHSA